MKLLRSWSKEKCCVYKFYVRVNENYLNFIKFFFLFIVILIIFDPRNLRR